MLLTGVENATPASGAGAGAISCAEAMENKATTITAKNALAMLPCAIFMKNTAPLAQIYEERKH